MEASVSDGLVAGGESFFGIGLVGFVLRPSINFLTVSDNFGGACLEDLGRGSSGISAIFGAKTRGVVDFSFCWASGLFREIFGTLGVGAGVGRLGRAAFERFFYFRRRLSLGCTCSLLGLFKWRHFL